MDKIKVLGVIFENGRRAVDTNENWTGRIKNSKTLTRIIQLWGKRDLSVMGKIVTVIFFVGKSANLYYAISRPSRKRSFRC